MLPQTQPFAFVRGRVILYEKLFMQTSFEGWSAKRKTQEYD